MMPLHIQVLSPEARERAKQHKDSKYNQGKIRTSRKSRILDSVNDMLGGAFEGVELRKAESAKDVMPEKSAPETPVQVGRRRYQRRGSCTMFNLLDTDSSHNTPSSHHSPRRSPTIADSRKSPRQTRRPSAPPLSYSSHSNLANEDSPQPQTIDARPIPRRNSRIQNQQFDENKTYTSIDQRPIPLKNSSHHRRHTTTGANFPMVRNEQMLESSDDDDDMSLVSEESFHDEVEPRTIDQRPLPFKKQQSMNLNSSSTTMTPTSRQQRTVRNSFHSAPTLRRPSAALPPRSPGALSRHRTSKLSKSTSSVMISPFQKAASQERMSSSSTRRRSTTSSGGDIPPPPPPLFDEDESTGSHLGSPPSSRRSSPPKKKLKSPLGGSLRTTRSMFKTLFGEDPSSSQQQQQPRRKSAGALSAISTLPLSGELPLAGGSYYGDNDDDSVALLEEEAEDVAPSSRNTRRSSKHAASTGSPATPKSPKRGSPNNKPKKRLSLSLRRDSSSRNTSSTTTATTSTSNHRRSSSRISPKQKR